MRIVVFGAGGFLGRVVVRSLRRGGHSVVGVVHSASQQDAVVQAGGEPRLGDILSPASIAKVSSGADLAIHLAQPSSGDLAAMRAVRVQGCEALVRTLPSVGVTRLVVGSGYWVYRDNPSILEEGSPLAPMSISQVNFETEEVARRSASAGIETVYVRPGMVYGPGSWFGAMVEELRNGTYRYVGDGSGYMSPIHWHDAGEAFRFICEKGGPDETYLTVDDAPMRTREFAQLTASAIGAKPPSGISFEEASRDWGRELALLNLASRQASNRKLRSLGWRPQYPSAREGLSSVLAELVPAA